MSGEVAGTVVSKGIDAGAGRARTLFFAALLVLAGILAWSNALDAPFVLDDTESIAANPTIRHLADLGAVFRPPPDSSFSGRPLGNLTLAINYALDGLNPRGYHLFNLGAHLLAALSLMGLVGRTLATTPLKDRFGGHAGWLAFGIALLWLLHPLQTAAVTYTTQRVEVLASLFILLTLYCVARGVAEGEWNAVWCALAFVSCLLAMASKETAYALPLLAPLYDRTFYAGTFREAWNKRKILYLTLAACWLPLAALILGAGSRNGTAGFGLGVAPIAYAATETVVLAKYLALFLWPSPLVFDYGPGFAFPASLIAPAALLAASLLAATLYALSKNRPEGFCGALFFAVLAPTTSFVPLHETIFEYRMYLPLASLLALLVPAVYALAVKPAWGGKTKVLLLPLAVLALALGGSTFARNRDYATDLSLWRDTVEKRPENPRARISLATALFARGDYAGAEEENERAVVLDPSYGRAWANLGMARLKIGKPGEAALALKRAVELDPGNPKTRYNLGRALFAAGDMAGGAEEFRLAVASGQAPPLAVRTMAEELAAAGLSAEAAEFYGVVRSAAVQAGDDALAAEADARMRQLLAR